MEIVSLTFDVVGKIMIAYTAIRVHFRFRKEHQIDDVVFKEMKREQFIGVFGIIFLVVGYLIRVFLVL